MEKPIGFSSRIGIGQQLVDFAQMLSNFKTTWGDTLQYIHACVLMVNVLALSCCE